MHFSRLKQNKQITAIEIELEHLTWSIKNLNNHEHEAPNINIVIFDAQINKKLRFKL